MQAERVAERGGQPVAAAAPNKSSARCTSTSTRRCASPGRHGCRARDFEPRATRRAGAPRALAAALTCLGFPATTTAHETAVNELVATGLYPCSRDLAAQRARRRRLRRHLVEVQDQHPGGVGGTRGPTSHWRYPGAGGERTET